MKCELCDSPIAVNCEQCGLSLCKLCDQDVHSTPEKRAHKRVPAGNDSRSEEEEKKMSKPAIVVPSISQNNQNRSHPSMMSTSNFLQNTHGHDQTGNLWTDKDMLHQSVSGTSQAWSDSDNAFQPAMSQSQRSNHQQGPQNQHYPPQHLQSQHSGQYHPLLSQSYNVDRPLPEWIDPRLRASLDSLVNGRTSRGHDRAGMVKRSVESSSHMFKQFLTDMASEIRHVANTAQKSQQQQQQLQQLQATLNAVQARHDMPNGPEMKHNRGHHHHQSPGVEDHSHSASDEPSYNHHLRRTKRRNKSGSRSASPTSARFHHVSGAQYCLEAGLHTQEQHDRWEAEAAGRGYNKRSHKKKKSKKKSRRRRRGKKRGNKRISRKIWNIVTGGKSDLGGVDLNKFFLEMQGKLQAFSSQLQRDRDMERLADDEELNARELDRLKYEILIKNLEEMNTLHRKQLEEDRQRRLRAEVDRREELDALLAEERAEMMREAREWLQDQINQLNRKHDQEKTNINNAWQTKEEWYLSNQQESQKREDKNRANAMKLAESVKEQLDTERERARKEREAWEQERKRWEDMRADLSKQAEQAQYEKKAALDDLAHLRAQLDEQKRRNLNLKEENMSLRAAQQRLIEKGRDGDSLRDQLNRLLAERQHREERELEKDKMHRAERQQWEEHKSYLMRREQHLQDIITRLRRQLSDKPMQAFTEFEKTDCCTHEHKGYHEGCAWVSGPLPDEMNIKTRVTKKMYSSPSNTWSQSELPDGYTPSYTYKTYYAPERDNLGIDNDAKDRVRTYSKDESGMYGGQGAWTSGDLEIPSTGNSIEIASGTGPILKPPTDEPSLNSAPEK